MKCSIFVFSVNVVYLYDKIGDFFKIFQQKEAPFVDCRLLIDLRYPIGRFLTDFYTVKVTEQIDYQFCSY